MSELFEPGPKDIRIEPAFFPDTVIVRVHNELPRDPKRPHFVRTEPEDRVYTRVSTGEPKKRAKSFLEAAFLAGFAASGDAAAEFCQWMQAGCPETGAGS